MKAWKAAALIVPAGLLIGMAAGAATRPVMIQNAEDYWPASVAEARDRIDPPRPFYEGGPQDLTPDRYSYRPNLDYSAYSWPDQGEPTYSVANSTQDVDMEVAPGPEVHRAGPIEAIGQRAEAAAEDALAAAGRAEPDSAPPDESEGETAPAPVPAFETEAF